MKRSGIRNVRWFITLFRWLLAIVVVIAALTAGIWFVKLITNG